MSFGYHTPESLLPRSDSKNPATTCKGLTTSGRPCRRALASSTTNSPGASPGGYDSGVVAILDRGDAAAFFCWQHKDQAELLVTKLQERTRVVRLTQKSSIDTLVDRLGVLDLDQDVPEVTTPTPKHRPHKGERTNREPKKKHTLPQGWQDMQGPLLTVPEEVVDSFHDEKPDHATRILQQRRPPRSGQARRSNVKASWSCCIRADEDDSDSPPRRPNRSENRRPKRLNSTGDDLNIQHSDRQYRKQAASSTVHRKPVNTAEMQQRSSTLMSSNDATTAQIFSRPSERFVSQSRCSPSSPAHSQQTAMLLSLIPPHLSPETTSALLTELSRPISTADEEGYIYIFWLTPESETIKPDQETASSLLNVDEPLPAPSPGRPVQQNNVSHQQVRNSVTAHALQRFASIKRTPTDQQKILLKIGRAANVHRRLSQWTKQCGQNVTLIRYYPYHPFASSANPISTQEQTRHKVPHVHRVERLIHLELADQRVTDKEPCQACGRIHKEWFEVNASRQGVRDVDEVIRRWVGWAERAQQDDLSDS